MSTCPAGHSSQADDYCDVCGLPIDTAAASPSPPPLPDAPAPVAAGECPNCHVPTPVNALFCEACGYDFTTGSLPRPVQPLTPPTPATPVTPVTPVTVADAVVPAVPTTNASPAPADAWVAEVWIDPDWYADQESTDPLPSPGLPTVVALRHSSVLIGRTSVSRGIHPDLDLGSDSGISRRHAQLTTDGTRWFVEDLGSSNGTYVAASTDPLPKVPVTVGQKREIGPDDRVYLGAWTRVVVRRAAPGEV